MEGGNKVRCRRGAARVRMLVAERMVGMRRRMREEPPYLITPKVRHGETNKETRGFIMLSMNCRRV